MNNTPYSSVMSAMIAEGVKGVLRRGVAVLMSLTRCVDGQMDRL